MDYAVCCFRVLVLLPSGFARDLRRLGGIVSFSEVKHRMNICFSGEATYTNCSPNMMDVASLHPIYIQHDGR